MNQSGRSRRLREEQIFLVIAVVIGVYSGLSVACFRIAIEWVRLHTLGSALIPAFPRVVLVPAAVGLVVAVIVVRFFPAVRGSGVNQTKAALLHLRRLHLVPCCRRQVSDVGARDRRRPVARPRGSIAADWRGPGVRARPSAPPLPRPAALHRAGRGGGRTRRGVQLADYRGAVRHRGGHRPMDRRRPRSGRAGGRVQRRDGAVVSRRRAAVSGAAVPPRAYLRAARVRRARFDRRGSLAPVRQADRRHQAAPAPAAAVDLVCAASRRWIADRPHRTQISAGHGRRL